MNHQAITPEQAAKLLQADVANMVKGIAAGRLLTVGQRKLLLRFAHPGDVAENQTELAAALSVNIRTCRRWLKMPGNPGRTEGVFRIGAWRRWVEMEGRKGAEATITDSGPEIVSDEQLLARALLALEGPF